MGLRQIAPIDTTGLKPAAVDQDMPELSWAAPTSLFVDDVYQREVSGRSNRLVRKLVENFEWNRVKPVIAVRSDDGSLHVIDGQHTAIVAATLSIPRIPVMIVKAVNVDERARAFVGHNRDRVVVSPHALFNALVAANDAQASAAAKACRLAGVRIRVISPGCVLAVGDTGAVGVIRGLVKRRSVIKSRKVLECLVKAERKPISGAEILAVEELLCREKPVDGGELSAIIKSDGDKGINTAHGKAKQDQIPHWRALVQRWDRKLTSVGVT